MTEGGGATYTIHKVFPEKFYLHIYTSKLFRQVFN